MTPTPTPRRLLLGLALGAALLAAASPVEAQILPSLQQTIATPVGTASAGASQDGANACLDAYTPALPAVPALPLPIGVPVPATYANADVCASAGLDGVSLDASSDAMGLQVGTGTEVDTSSQHAAAEGVLDQVKGFFSGIANAIGSWF